MTRQRRTARTAATSRSTPGQRVRRRLADQPELELTEEELRALADEGIDPEDVRRLARERRESEASDHDRDTARDDLEGLVLEAEDDYGA